MDNREAKRRVKEEGWLRVRMIQEIAGFPKEHVESSMDQMNGVLAKVVGLEVLEREVHEVRLVDEKNKIWSMFAELELLIKDFSTLLLVIYDFMPSSIEILEPETIREDTNKLGGAVNDMIAKLHQLDSSVKKLFAQGRFLAGKLEKYEGKK